MTKKPEAILTLLQIVGWLAFSFSVAAGIYLAVVASNGLGNGVSLFEWFCAGFGLVSGLILVGISALINGVYEVAHCIPTIPRGNTIAAGAGGSGLTE